MEKANNITILLKRAMQLRHISQVQMADMLGISKQTLYNRLNRNSVSVTAAVGMFDLLEYDIAIVDRKTGDVIHEKGVKK